MKKQTLRAVNEYDSLYYGATSRGQGGNMSQLVSPHGGKLTSRLVKGDELAEERKRARELLTVHMTSRETSDLIMIGIGAFSPLDGFMGREDWEGVCRGLAMANGIFWPIPITLSISGDNAARIKEGSEVGLRDAENGKLVCTIKVEQKYAFDKGYECKEIFKTDDPKHPGVAKVMTQEGFNLAGPVNMFSELDYPR
jgi:sulfate adenylyltransferase